MDPRTRNAACRSCSHGQLVRVLSLGDTPRANALLTQAQLMQSEPVFPLDVAFCPHCALVQIVDTVPPEHLFRDYQYQSSMSDAFAASAMALVEREIGRRGLGVQSLIVEIGSNDGCLLRNYAARGIPILGIDPAVDIASIAAARGVPTLCEFFDMQVARRIVDARGPAAVIHANNVLAHIPDANGAVAAIKALLAPDGVAIIEVPYVRDLIERVEFDTIYHEHVFYFSLTSASALFSRHELAVADVEYLDIHGGTLRMFLAHAGVAAPSAAVTALTAREREDGMCELAFYEHFANAVLEVRANLTAELRRLRQAGKRIAAYGAAAKGATLLNFCGIGTETLDFVADRNPLKHGRFMPGVRMPIVPVERILQEMPDYLLLLAWNFAAEIRQQQAEYVSRGGQFLLPLTVRPTVAQ